MSIILKQLILSQLHFPKEVIDLIKDFAFCDPIFIKTKKTKNEIIALINNTFYSPIHFWPLLPPIQYIFFVETDNNSVNSTQIQAEFCLKCGNYTISYEANINIRCNCLEM